MERFRAIGDVDRAAELLARSTSPAITLGWSEEVQRRLERAEMLVAGRPDGPAAAVVAEIRCSLAMLDRRFGAAAAYGEQAIALAEQTGNDTVLAATCVQSGIALAMSGDDAGLDRIRRGIDIATRLGDDRIVSLGHLQIGSGYGELRRYDVAVPALEAAAEHASEREFVASMLYSRAWLARCRLELGEWDSPGRLANDVLRHPRAAGISRFVALVTLGWLRARRGDPDVIPLLDEALELARATQHLQRLWPVAACRAEVAWLHGDVERELAVLDEAFELARSSSTGRRSRSCPTGGRWRTAGGMPPPRRPPTRRSASPPAVPTTWRPSGGVRSAARTRRRWRGTSPVPSISSSWRWRRSTGSARRRCGRGPSPRCARPARPSRVAVRARHPGTPPR